MSHDALQEVKRLRTLLHKKQREIDLMRDVVNEARRVASMETDRLVTLQHFIERLDREWAE